MNAPHDDFQKAVELLNEQTSAMQSEFGQVLGGKGLISNRINYPNNSEETAKLRQGVKALIEGSLLVYLFAMWEAYVPSDLHEWLIADEKEKLKAYKHVRHSAAHGYKGKRADLYRDEFEAHMPFDGIQWDQENDTIDISNASVAQGLHGYLSELGKQLLIRLHKNEKP